MSYSEQSQMYKAKYMELKGKTSSTFNARSPEAFKWKNALKFEFKPTIKDSLMALSVVTEGFKPMELKAKLQAYKAANSAILSGSYESKTLDKLIDTVDKSCKGMFGGLGPCKTTAKEVTMDYDTIMKYLGMNSQSPTLMADLEKLQLTLPNDDGLINAAISKARFMAWIKTQNSEVKEKYFEFNDKTKETAADKKKRLAADAKEYAKEYAKMKEDDNLKYSKVRFEKMGIVTSGKTLNGVIEQLNKFYNEIRGTTTRYEHSYIFGLIKNITESTSSKCTTLKLFNGSCKVTLNDAKKAFKEIMDQYPGKQPHEVVKILRGLSDHNAREVARKNNAEIEAIILRVIYFAWAYPKEI
jgi:hypothetical protein